MTSSTIPCMPGIERRTQNLRFRSVVAGLFCSVMSGHATLRDESQMHSLLAKATEAWSQSHYPPYMNCSENLMWHHHYLKPAPS